MPNPLPVAITIPHSGLPIPPELAGRIALTNTQIFNEADAYADQVYDFRDRVLHWVRFPYARAIVDVNRPPDPKLNRPGDGIIKAQTSYGTPVFRPGMEPTEEERQQLIATYFEPWHARLAEIAADERVKLVIDGHTMAAVGPLLYGDPGALRGWGSVSNQGDASGNPHPKRKRLTASPTVTRALAMQMAAHFGRLPALATTLPTVTINNPFWGGWDIRCHAHGNQHWFMVEINRALYIGLQESDTPITPPNETLLSGIREAMWQAIEAVLNTI